MKNKKFSWLRKSRLLAALPRRRAFAVATAVAALIFAAAVPWRAAQAQTQRQIPRQITPPDRLLGNALAVGVVTPRVAIVGDTLVVEGTAEDDRILIKATKRPDIVLTSLRLRVQASIPRLLRAC